MTKFSGWLRHWGDVLGLLDQTFKNGDTTRDAKLLSHEMERILMLLQNDLYNLSCSSLRNLLFYQTISRSYTRLSGGEIVYEVPASVPGDDLEALSTLTSFKFLRQAPKLTELYQYIRIKQISEVMFHIDIVIKHFSLQPFDTTRKNNPFEICETTFCVKIVTIMLRYYLF